MNFTVDFQKYLERRGAKGERALKSLAELGVAINVLIDSPLGAKVLDGDIQRLDALMNKNLSQDLTDDEKIEMRYIYRRIENIVAMIENHKTILEDVKSIGG